MEIVLTNRPEAEPRLFKALEAFAADHYLPAKVLQAADLALAEHVTNVFKHAYADTALHEIHVRLSCDGRALYVEIEDDGRAFNPLQTPLVNTSIPLEERPIGGLGVHLMRRYMDTLEYRREGSRNILRMTKRLGS
ncbi:MAG: ATP-binding protein [Verrucomicrobia bacterium]|nr:ATP-binding protein [Verrucomicrobiota bacterium]